MHYRYHALSINSYLQLYPEHCGLPGQAIDVLIAKPEVPIDCTKAILVLLPIPVEAGQTYSTSLDDCPSTSIFLHITEHLNSNKLSVIKNMLLKVTYC